MNITLWVLQILLALIFLAAGSNKAFNTATFMKASDWTKSSSSSTIKFIGWLEIVGAIGLILPLALDIVPILTPLAASGLGLTMVFAGILHGKRGEMKSVLMNIILLIIAVVIAVGRM